MIRERSSLFSGESDQSGSKSLLKKIEDANMSEEALKAAKEELKRLEGLHHSSADYHVIRNYIDWLSSMPWNISSSEEINLDKSEDIQEKHHYGIKRIKKRILEHLAVTKLKGNLKSPIICLKGLPAGITMLTAMASLVSEKVVSQDIGMTGELTLSGSVLPIGGLKEKVIAAHRQKIKKNHYA